MWVSPYYTSSDFVCLSISIFLFIYFCLKVSIALRDRNLSGCISISLCICPHVSLALFYIYPPTYLSLCLSPHLSTCVGVLDTGGTHKTDQRHHLHLAPLPRHPLSKQGGGRGASMGRGSSINQPYRPLLQLHPFAVSSGVPFITLSLPLSLPLPHIITSSSSCSWILSF